MMKKFLYVARPAFQGEITLILQRARGGLLLRLGLAEQQALGHQPSPCHQVHHPKGQALCREQRHRGRVDHPDEGAEGQRRRKGSGVEIFLIHHIGQQPCQQQAGEERPVTGCR